MDQEAHPAAKTAGLMNQAEAATYLGLAEMTLQQWRTTGRTVLPYVKIGRLVRYRRADLDTFIASRWRCTSCSDLLPGRSAADIAAGNTDSAGQAHGCAKPALGKPFERLDLEGAGS